MFYFFEIKFTERMLWICIKDVQILILSDLHRGGLGDVLLAKLHQENIQMNFGKKNRAERHFLSRL